MAVAFAIIACTVVLVIVILYVKGALVADLTALRAAVEEQTTVNASAIQLLEELAALIRATPPDQASIDALADEVAGNVAELAASVEANTVEIEGTGGTVPPDGSDEGPPIG